jgi:hypothetical protein
VEVTQFIEDDIKRASHRSPWLRVLLGAGVFLFPVTLGVFLRDRIDGVFDPHTFVPNTLAILALVFSASFLVRKANPKSDFKWGMLGLLMALYFATDRIYSADIRTEYASSESFWRESFHCFTKGGLTTLVMGLWLAFFAFTISAWPSRRWRGFLSVAAGVSGAIMLGFHCDSSSVAHVLVAHVGQGIVFGVVLFLAQEVYFYSGLKRAIPGLAGKIRKFHKLG